MASLPSSADSAQTTDTAETNKAVVRRAFEEWANGSTHFFDILDDEAKWTIAGSGPSAQTFHDRNAFLASGYGPIAERFATPMKPEVLGIYADGDEVIIRWDGASEMRGGQTYRNSYAWFFRMRNGKVIEATAFLDLPTYDAALDGKPLPPWPTI